jgi:hypothetical protein
MNRKDSEMCENFRGQAETKGEKMEKKDVAAIAMVRGAIFAGYMGWLGCPNHVKTALLVTAAAWWMVSLLNTSEWFRQATSNIFSNRFTRLPFASARNAEELFRQELRKFQGHPAEFLTIPQRHGGA